MREHYDELDLVAIQSTGRLDANESIFFAKELDYVKSKAYDVKYPANNALALFPVTSEADPGADTISYDSYDMVGMAKIIANYADDLPRADVKGTRETVKVFGIGTSYGYSTKDIRRARMAGKPLSTRKAEAARRANDTRINNIAFWGDEESGIVGILNHPNISKYVIPGDGSSSATEWASKTAEQIIRDMNAAVSSVVDATNGVEIPDTMLLPIKQYNLIAGMLMPDSSGFTVLKFFLENNPYITTVKAVHELKGADDGDDVMLIYRNSSDALSLELPLPFTQLAPQRKNLEFVVPCESSTAGIIVYYPLSVCLASGI
jgi:hypothetical protein